MFERTSCSRFRWLESIFVESIGIILERNARNLNLLVKVALLKSSPKADEPVTAHERFGHPASLEYQKASRSDKLALATPESCKIIVKSPANGGAEKVARKREAAATAENPGGQTEETAADRGEAAPGRGTTSATETSHHAAGPGKECAHALEVFGEHR